MSAGIITLIIFCCHSVHLAPLLIDGKDKKIIMSKYILIIALAVGIAVGSAGTLFISKAIKPVINIPACPPCNCPPATEVKLQDFDLDKLNNKKGNFTYAPQLNNVRVIIESKDSLMLKQLLRK